MENQSLEPVQMRDRVWKVYSGSGNLESVRGKGVVGVQPILKLEHPVFQYHSHVSVESAMAHMWGSFYFERDDGETIDVKVPTFSLFDPSNIAKEKAFQ